MTMTVFRLSVALLVAFATAAVGANDDTMSISMIPQGGPIERKLQDQTIGQIVGATEDLSDLFGLFEARDLTPTISIPFVTLTLFAPVNSAFDDLDPELLATLRTDAFSQHLREVVLYHVTDGQTLSADLVDQEFTMINGNAGKVEVEVLVVDPGGGIFLLSDSSPGVRAQVIGVDILAVNGVVHLIDAVLLPSFMFRRVSDLGENYSTLLSLAVMSEVDEILRLRTITLFAPTNDAFTALPADILDTLSSTEGQDTLEDILLYHALDAVITSDKLLLPTIETTRQGSPVIISVLGDGTVRVNGATVVQPDMLARNGVAHGIDRVLLPPDGPTTESPTIAPSSSQSPTIAPSSSPTIAPSSSPTSAPVASPVFAPVGFSTSAPVAVASPTGAPLMLQSLLGFASDMPALSTLVSAVTAADLIPILSNPSVELTLFAPTDDAFAALDPEVLARLLTTPFQMHLENVLLYHLWDGETDLSGGLDITTVNKEIVTVGMNATTVSLSNSQGLSALIEGVDIAASNGIVYLIDGVLLPSFVYRTVIDLEETYSTLFSVIELAELADTLMASTITLFAPTNAAFAKLEQETLDFLTSPDGKGTLSDILTYHAISDVITAEKLVDGATVVTVQGGSVAIGVMDGTVMVNDATVVKADILASNGVTHGIDSVLMLPENSGPTMSSGVTSAPTMAPATSSGVTFGTSFFALIVMALAMTF